MFLLNVIIRSRGSFRCLVSAFREFEVVLEGDFFRIECGVTGGVGGVEGDGLSVLRWRERNPEVFCG